jgi:hypothetical protein
MHFLIVLLLVSHGVVCIFSTGKFAAEGDLLCIENNLKIWTMLCGLFFVCEFARTDNMAFKSPLNFYLLLFCLSGVAHLLINKVICASFSYCFSLHSMSGVLLMIFNDSGCGALTRTVSALALSMLVVAVFAFPVRLELSIQVFFVEHVSKAFHDTSFEAAHLCAIFACSVLRIVVDFLTFCHAQWNQLIY